MSERDPGISNKNRILKAAALAAAVMSLAATVFQDKITGEPTPQPADYERVEDGTVGSQHSTGSFNIDITKAKKTDIRYEDGKRLYTVSGSGYEFVDGAAEDACGIDGQYVTSVDYRGLYLPATNDAHPSGACLDMRLSSEDFESTTP